MSLFEREPPPDAPPRDEPSREETPPVARPGLRFWLLGAAALAALEMLAVVFNLDAWRYLPDRRPLAWADMLGLAAPFAVGFGAIACGRSRPFGLAVIGTFAALVCAGLAWLMLGFVGAYGPFAVLHLAVVGPLGLIHAALAMAAFAPLRRTADASRLAVVGGIGATIVYGVVGFAALLAFERHVDRTILAKAQATPDAQSGNALEALKACLPEIRAFRAERPWPRTPADLGPGGLKCLTAEQVAPPDHSFEIVVGAAPGTGPTGGFSVCVATWRTSNLVEAYVLDERHEFMSELGSAATPSVACVDTYRTDRLRKLRWCLWEWAAAHDGRYPEDLARLSERTGCATLGAHHAELAPRAIVYVPTSAADGAGPTGFTAIEPSLDARASGPDSGILRRARRLDDTGAIHATTEGHLPGIHDPDDNGRRGWAYKLYGGEADAEVGCRRGNPHDCVLLANFLAPASGGTASLRRDYTPPSPERTARAEAVLRRACDAWSAEGCSRVAGLLEPRPDGATQIEARRLRLRACARDPFYCSELSPDLTGLSSIAVDPRDRRPLDAQCRDGIADACEPAGRRAETRAGGRQAALALYEAGCEHGAERSCLSASRLLAKADDPLDRRRSQALQTLACSVTAGVPECATP